VIAGICHDLCIAPDHPLWQEFREALAAFGVTLTVPKSEQDEARPAVRAAVQPGTQRPTIRALYAAECATAAQAEPRPHAQEPTSAGPPELLHHPIAA
jgi:hypothetical protein